MICLSTQKQDCPQFFWGPAIMTTASGAERKGRTGVKMTKAEKEKEIARLEKQMKEAARMMEYEYAAILRDQIIELRGNGLK